jgi:hypothetical protein
MFVGDHSMKLVLTTIAMLTALTLVGTTGRASTVTYDSSVSFFRDISSARVIRTEDWDRYAPRTILNNGTTLNGITYQATTGYSRVVNTGQSLSPPNNLFYDGGFNPLRDTRTFRFSRPVDFFGIFVVSTFAINDGDFYATTNRGDMASSVYNPFFPGNLVNFIGLKTDRPFRSVEISANVNAGYGLDDMYFGRFRGGGTPAPIPIPATLSLLLAGVGVLGFIAHRRKTALPV